MCARQWHEQCEIRGQFFFFFFQHPFLSVLSYFPRNYIGRCASGFLRNTCMSKRGYVHKQDYLSRACRSVSRLRSTNLYRSIYASYFSGYLQRLMHSMAMHCARNKSYYLHVKIFYFSFSI